MEYLAHELLILILILKCEALMLKLKNATSCSHSEEMELLHLHFHMMPLADLDSGYPSPPWMGHKLFRFTVSVTACVLCECQYKSYLPLLFSCRIFHPFLLLFLFFCPCSNCWHLSLSLITDRIYWNRHTGSPRKMKNVNIAIT